MSQEQQREYIVRLVWHLNTECEAFKGLSFEEQQKKCDELIKKNFNMGLIVN
jgi:hypothetical protein